MGRLNELYLRSFRNYGEDRLEFAPGVNLIVGQNAQGKTNLLEAIAFLGSGKSFRALKNAEMIGFSAPFCELEGKITAQERQQSIRWLLFPTRQPRQLQINGVRKKSAADLNGLLPTVLFCPEDLMILKAGASAHALLRFSIIAAVSSGVASQLLPSFSSLAFFIATRSCA